MPEQVFKYEQPSAVAANYRPEIAVRGQTCARRNSSLRISEKHRLFGPRLSAIPIAKFRQNILGNHHVPLSRDPAIRLASCELSTSWQTSI